MLRNWTRAIALIFSTPKLNGEIQRKDDKELRTGLWMLIASGRWLPIQKRNGAVVCCPSRRPNSYHTLRPADPAPCSCWCRVFSYFAVFNGFIWQLMMYKVSIVVVLFRAKQLIDAGDQKVYKFDYKLDFHMYMSLQVVLPNNDIQELFNRLINIRYTVSEKYWIIITFSLRFKITKSSLRLGAWF